MTLDLRIFDKVDRLFAELHSASGEARAGPVENTILESERGADRARSIRYRERLALDVEVRRNVATVDTQELTATDIVLSGR